MHNTSQSGESPGRPPVQLLLAWLRDPRTPAALRHALWPDPSLRRARCGACGRLARPAALAAYQLQGAAEPLAWYAVCPDCAPSLAVPGLREGVASRAEARIRRALGGEGEP